MTKVLWFSRHTMTPDQEQFLKIAGNKPVLTAKSDRIIIPDENGGESKIEFRFRQWDRLLKVEVLTEPLVTIDDIRKE